MTQASQLLVDAWRQHQAGKVSVAEGHYRRVLRTNPNDGNAWWYLGIACHDQGRFEEAVAAYDKAIQLVSDSPALHNNLGNTLRALKRVDESIDSFRRALQLKSDYAIAHMNLGVTFLLNGDFAQGWPEYRWRWQTNNFALRPGLESLWDGSSLDGRTILLTPEQGFGDTLQFYRYTTFLKEKFDCKVIVECHRRLLPLLQTSGGADELVASGEPLPPFDVFAPLMDVPGILGQDEDSFPTNVPYLRADKARVERWKQKLGDRQVFRIGLAWQANPEYSRDCLQSIPPDALRHLAKLHGVQLFGLQMGHGAEQAANMHEQLEIVDFGPEFDEQAGAFMDTAAVIENLDLLIVSDSAVGHLAGAMGAPVWLALPHVPDWRWQLDRDDTPWYPTMQLFRQPSWNTWPQVFDRITQELTAQQPNAIRLKTPEEYRVAATGLNRLNAARYGLMLYNPRDMYIGKSIENYGEYSDSEVTLFRQIIPSGGVVVEAGANIGSHTLAISEFVGDEGAVYAFEPQGAVFQILCANMALNSRLNVKCYCEAVGENPAHTLVRRLNFRVENNFGGLSVGGDLPGDLVPVVTVDSLQLPRCNLLKADVEGGELGVIKGAAETIKKYHPALYIESPLATRENDREERSAALIAHIMSLDYDLYWHAPLMFNPKNFYGNPSNVFATIISLNMLCVHRSVPSKIQGLRRIDGPESNWWRA